MDITHCLVEHAATSDQLSTALKVLACFSFLLRLFAHIRVFSGVQGPISHFSDELADFWLAFHNFESGLLVAQCEFLKFIRCHVRVFTAEFGGHGKRRVQKVKVRQDLTMLFFLKRLKQSILVFRRQVEASKVYHDDSEVVFG